MGVFHVQMFKCYQIAQRIWYFFEAFQSGLKFVFLKLIPILKKESENNESLGGLNNRYLSAGLTMSLVKKDFIK